MNDKIGNSIVRHQQTINELLQIKNIVGKNINKKVKFCVHSKELFHSWEPMPIYHKNNLDISPDTMFVILNEAIRKERERIDKLIDMEIDRELERRSKNK